MSELRSRATYNRMAIRIWESYHGCKLPKGYLVHHCDGNIKN
ncbi:unnamed protein product, partial [marine sediment metagenome]